MWCVVRTDAIFLLIYDAASFYIAGLLSSSIQDQGKKIVSFLRLGTSCVGNAVKPLPCTEQFYVAEHIWLRSDFPISPSILFAYRDTCNALVRMNWYSELLGSFSIIPLHPQVIFPDTMICQVLVFFLSTR